MEPSVVINDVLECVQELKSRSIIRPSWVGHLIKAKETVRVDE